MFYFFILSIEFQTSYHWWQVARRCKAHTTKSDWVLYMVHVGHTPKIKIIVRRWFWTSTDVYWGAIVFIQIRRSWKGWGFTVFFLWKILGSQLEINKILLQCFAEIWVQWQPPCKLSTLRSIGVALLVYGNTAVPMVCHTIFDYQIRGSQNIAEVRLELMNPLFQSMVIS